MCRSTHACRSHLAIDAAAISTSRAATNTAARIATSASAAPATATWSPAIVWSGLGQGCGGMMLRRQATQLSNVLFAGKSARPFKTLSAYRPTVTLNPGAVSQVLKVGTSVWLRVDHPSN